jgi:hypothetical protein
MIAAYRDDCGFVGEPRRPDAAVERAEAADLAGRRAYMAADDLAGVLDRAALDYGTDADALDEIAVRIRAITAEVAALLGEAAR